MSRIGWLAVGLLAACSKPVISGRVVDVAGQPVAGAMITNTTGSLCTTETAADGTFALGCSGENLVLAVGQDGWFSNEIKAMGAFDEAVGDVRLVKKAPEHGLWRWQGGDWVSFDRPGRVRREVPRSNDARRHYLERGASEAHEIAAGRVILLDDSADEWRLWRIGERDLVHAEVAPNPSRWETEYGQQPEMSYEKIEGGRDLITVALEPGEYFLADWKNGRFNQSKKDSLYTGRWVVAR